jgi:MFS family permease
MVPVGRLVLLRSVPRNEIVQALAYLTMPALVGPILGPPLGGFITTYSDWRWIFWINVPIGVLGVTLATLFIEDIKEDDAPPLDVPGFIMTGLGLSGLMFGMTVAGRGSVPSLVVASLIGGGLILLGFYIRHARHAAHPIIDLKLLSIPTFAASLYGGFLFRLGIGALPFLLPLLLQLGFGLSPFQSGCLTFGAAAGAFLMKTTAQPILRRFGFRRVMVFNAIVSSIFMALYGLFTASTPWWMMFALLAGGGFFRSLEFTSINAIAYADISTPAMSRATSFSSVMQQLSLSTGVAFGAAVIEFSRMAHGDAVLRAEDFGTAFLLVALISACSALIFMRLPATAAAALTRRGEERAAPSMAAAATPAGRDG